MYGTHRIVEINLSFVKLGTVAVFVYRENRIYRNFFYLPNTNEKEKNS